MKFITSTISAISALILLFGIYSGKILWIIVGITPLIIIGVITFFLYRAKVNKLGSIIREEIDSIIRNGEKIPVDFENCEIKDSSYSQDIIDERMTRFSHLNLDYGKVIGQENVGQSLLVYNHSGSNGKEKFIQAFPLGAESLKVNIIRKLVTLYVDRFNRSRYYFDLKSEYSKDRA